MLVDSVDIGEQHKTRLKTHDDAKHAWFDRDKRKRQRFDEWICIRSNLRVSSDLSLDPVI